MFTGLVEEIGKLTAMQPSGSGLRCTVNAREILQDIHIGDSIAINGICQTVVAFTTQSFSFDTVAETLSKTTLGQLRTGHPVHLERALKAESRLGGHFVLGHVDTVGTITSIRSLNGSFEMRIAFPLEFSQLIVPVGSIAIDGVSLTVAELDDSSFTVAIIPHTWNSTVFSEKKSGDMVNLEFDILGKYVQRMLNPYKSTPKITETWLKEHGF
ncbi:MAG: riboflavin synthase [Ignavibacteria bacterium]|nr:riboflavin synthase [Ignavibacteria bacterium]